MKISNWWEITTPHKDITDGHFDESIFAADLGNVMNKMHRWNIWMGQCFLKKPILQKD